MYLAWAVKLHPDKTGGNPASEELFKKINEAYQVLGDKAKRDVYDNKLLFFKTFHDKKNEPGQAPPSPAYTPPAGYGGPNYTPPVPIKENIGRNVLVAISMFAVLGAIFWGFYRFMQNYSATHHYEEAMVWEKNQSWREAYNNYTDAISFNPDMVDAYVHRGYVAIKLSGNYRAAYYDFNSAISRSDKPETEWYYMRGLCAFNSDIKEAIDDFNLVLKKDPKNYKALLARARCYASLLKRYPEAITDFKAYFEKVPDDNTMYDQCAFACYNNGNIDEAVKYYSLAILADPSAGKLYFNRAICHKDLGNKTEACADLMRSFERGFEDAKIAMIDYCTTP